MRKSEYLYCNAGKNGIEMTFKYRDNLYTIIKIFSFPEGEKIQHEYCQKIIDERINEYV
jgi:hypothetical protein